MNKILSYFLDRARERTALGLIVPVLGVASSFGAPVTMEQVGAVGILVGVLLAAIPDKKS